MLCSPESMYQISFFYLIVVIRETIVKIIVFFMKDNIPLWFSLFKFFFVLRNFLCCVNFLFSNEGFPI